MSAAYRRALATLAQIRSRLAGAATDADRAALLAELDDILALLDRADHRADTVQQARRVQHLDRQLADRPARERNDIIRQRLGVSRSRLYELRAVRLSPDGSSPSST